MAGRSDYTEEAVRAAHSVLLELHRILGEYREDIVVIGGWVPVCTFFLGVPSVITYS